MKLKPTNSITNTIEDKIEAYILTENELIIKPKDSAMRAITISRTRTRGIDFRGYINLLDFTDIWTAALYHSFKNKDFNLSNVYIELMGIEVALKWKGFLHKTAKFTNNPRLSKLSKHIPSLNVKSVLAKALNQNTELLNCIQYIKPDKIDAKLNCDTSTPDRENNFEILLGYIQDPSEIIWGIDVFVPLDRSMGKSASGPIDMMNLIAKKIVDLSRDQIMSL